MRLLLFVSTRHRATEIDINYCSDYDTQTDFCRSYGTTSVESSYRPPFQYSGDTCLSALLDTYDSIFLTAVLFSALVPATTEIIIVRVFASWCYTNIETSRFARFVLKFLRVVTWNVTPTLVEAGYIPFPEISRVNYQLQRVVERSCFAHIWAGRPRRWSGMRSRIACPVLSPLLCGWSFCIGSFNFRAP